MMQDWANRLDLWAQGYAQAAGAPLTIRLEGVASQSIQVNALRVAALAHNILAEPEMRRETGEGEHLGSRQSNCMLRSEAMI